MLYHFTTQMFEIQISTFKSKTSCFRWTGFCVCSRSLCLFCHCLPISKYGYLPSTLPQKFNIWLQLRNCKSFFSCLYFALSQMDSPQTEISSFHYHLSYVYECKSHVMGYNLRLHLLKIQ